MSGEVAQWQWIYANGLRWRRWGIGVEVSLGYYWPQEWSVYLHIGPLLLGVGRERSLFAPCSACGDDGRPCEVCGFGMQL